MKDYRKKTQEYILKKLEQRDRILQQIMDDGLAFMVNGEPANITAATRKLLRIPKAYRTKEEQQIIDKLTIPPEDAILVELGPVVLAVTRDQVLFENLSDPERERIAAVVTLNGHRLHLLPEESQHLWEAWKMQSVRPTALLRAYDNLLRKQENYLNSFSLG